jgi:hypothetical protein
MMLLCITLGSDSCAGLVHMYTSAIGRVSRSAPVIASAVAKIAPHCHSRTGVSSPIGRLTFRCLRGISDPGELRREEVSWTAPRARIAAPAGRSVGTLCVIPTDRVPIVRSSTRYASLVSVRIRIASTTGAGVTHGGRIPAVRAAGLCNLAPPIRENDVQDDRSCARHLGAPRLSTPAARNRLPGLSSAERACSVTPPWS